MVSFASKMKCMISGGEFFSGVITFPETDSLHLKMDGWNTRFFLGRPIFRFYVSFRERNWDPFLENQTTRRHPVILSGTDWGVQSHPQHSISAPLSFSEGDRILREYKYMVILKDVLPLCIVWVGNIFTLVLVLPSKVTRPFFFGSRLLLVCNTCGWLLYRGV